MRACHDWSGDAAGRLRALWCAGFTISEIGRRIGVSRNAVVGKAHRLDLPARPSPIRPPGPEYERRREQRLRARQRRASDLDISNACGSGR